MVYWRNAKQSADCLENVAARSEEIGRACFVFPVLPPDIHGEHKYHSLTVMCHLNSDGWSTGPQTHTHTHPEQSHTQSYKAHRDNLKTDLLRSWDSLLSVTHACIHTHAYRHRQ